MLDQLLFIRVRGKVLGPFNLPKLKTLRDRGQFGRFHEVSQDRRTWQSAATLAELFPAEDAAAAAPAAEVVLELQPLPNPITHRAATAPPRAQDRTEWHYLTPQGANQGPVPQEQLAALLQAGVITPATLVWKQGMPNWLPLSSPATGLPQSLLAAEAEPRRTLRRQPARGWRVVLLLGGTATVVGGLVLTGVLILNGLRNRDSGGTVPSATSQVITSLDEKELASSVCLVVCGLHVVNTLNGAQFDELHSSGSGFAVSVEGHILTNRHVIEEIWKWKLAETKLQRLRDVHHFQVKPTVWVFFSREKHLAEIVHVSDVYDMSILKVERRHVPFFRLSSSATHSRGKKVVACGFPGVARKPLSAEEAASGRFRQMSDLVDTFFSPRDFEFTLTDGTVSRITTEELSSRRWVQHTANINHGNSGGPLLVENGTVVGINTRGSADGPGLVVYSSLLLPQLKPEIEKHVPGAVWE